MDKALKVISLEEQLQGLAECGISLASGVDRYLLTSLASREQYEKDPYRLLLIAMGGEAEANSAAEHVGYLSDDIWHFDSECIEDHGAYSTLAERIAVLAHGDLPLEQIEDYVDVEEGEAWLSFTLDGRHHRWQARVEDDWVDPSILSKFAALLASRNVGKRFTYIDLGGQDCLIGCATPEQSACLEARTGLKVEWLT